jgi:hypothetical protein
LAAALCFSMPLPEPSGFREKISADRPHPAFFDLSSSQVRELGRANEIRTTRGVEQTFLTTRLL